jgi:hypothetical protein
MAFNPFSSFRKYQKIWIPGLLLVCMVSFIMCSGSGGEELSDVLLRMIRGESGEAVISLNETQVRFSKLDNLKKQRIMANIYMRESSRMALTTIEGAIADLKKAKDQKEAAKARGTLEDIRRMLIERLKEPNYFETGTKLEDLATFMLWQKEADKLGVQLVEADVRKITADLLFRAFFVNNYNTWGDDPKKALETVQYEFREATYEKVVEALSEEYRVKIAQLSLTSINSGNLPSPNLGIDFGIHPRVVLSPQQLEQKYKEKLTHFTVALLPVPVEHFVTEVKEPSEANLKEIFEQYQRTKYDPTTDVPGFELPEKMRVTWVTADPKSDYYQNLAKAMLNMEVSPPVHFDFGMPGFGTVMRHAAGKAAWDTRMNESFGLELQQQVFVAQRTGILPKYFVELSPVSPHFVLPLVTHPLNKPTPVMVASLVAGASQPGVNSTAVSNYQLRAFFEYGQKLRPAFEEEAKKRTPLAVLPLGTLNPFTVAPLAHWQYEAEARSIVPLPMVADEIEKNILEIAASAHAREIMLEVRKTVPKAGQDRVGNPITIQAWLDQFYQTHSRDSLTIQETDVAHNRFDIDKAPALKEFVEIFSNPTSLQHFNYMTGRTKQDKALDQADFYRLFFDASEEYSAGSASNYVVKQWPPVVTIPGAILPTKEHLDLEARDPELREKVEDLRKKKETRFDMWLTAEQPVLFWKSAYEPGFAPATYKDIEGVVRHAWKFRTAREEKALPAAEELAKSLEKKLSSDWSEERKAILEKVLQQGIQTKNIDLKPLAKDKKIEDADKLSREELFAKLLKQEGAGVLEKAIIDHIAAEKKVNADDAEKEWKITLQGEEAHLLAEQKVEALKKLVSPMGSEPIFLNDLAAWKIKDEEVQFGGQVRIYEDYKLSKDIIPYARKDTVEQLLTMGFRKAPLHIEGEDKLTRATKKSYDNVKARPNLPPIQLLTNQPRSHYYVAIVLEVDRPNLADFSRAYKFSSATQQGSMDSFVNHVYLDAARTFRVQFEEQMRAKAQYKVLQDKHGFD